MEPEDDQIEENQDKIRVACQIAHEAGVLGYCDEHDEYFDLFEDDKLEEAYKLADQLVSEKHRSVEIFNGNAAELIELLQAVPLQLQDCCPECEDFDEDDAEEDDDDDE